MNTRGIDTRAAVVARQRGRARLRKVTLAIGTASLAATGAIASLLPGTTHAVIGTSPAVTSGSGSAAHATSGGSTVTSQTTPTGPSGLSGSPVPATRSDHEMPGDS